MTLTCDLCGHQSSDQEPFFMAPPAGVDCGGTIMCAACEEAWHQRVADTWLLFCAARRGP